MLMVIEQYDTQEVYVKEALSAQPALTIWEYIERETLGYNIFTSIDDLKGQFTEWLHNKCNHHTSSVERHFRVDLYRGSEAGSFNKSIIVYFK